MIDVWLTCCRLDGGAYYWQQLGMFGLLMNMLSPCLQKILHKVTVILFDNSMTLLTYDYRVVTLLAEHTIDNKLACLVYWWTCCNFACRAYYSLPSESSGAKVAFFLGILFGFFALSSLLFLVLGWPFFPRLLITAGILWSGVFTLPVTVG